MIGYWVSFAIIALLIPIGLVFSKTWATKNGNYTDEQEKSTNINLLKYWMLYWLCDLFYMACFIDNLICTFIFGILIMLVIFLNVWSSFAFPKAKTKIRKYCILQDFLVGIGLTIYLIYIIPNEELQTIVIAIVSALYGGLITLTGVAWTIRKSDKDRKEDEIVRAKPFFSFVPLPCEPKGGTFKNICFPDLVKETNCIHEVYSQIDNSSLSVLILKRICHDGKWLDLSMNQTLIPGGSLILNFRCKNFLFIYLEVADTLGNSYFYKIELLGMPNPLYPSITSSGLKFNTIRGIKELSKDQINKELKEADFYDKSNNF